MSYSNFTIYVDESGDHSLERINPEYPLFVLTFCLITKCDYRQQVAPGVIEFKHHFGQRLPFEVAFVDKKQHLPGLQLADLVCHPMGRHLLKPDQPNRAYDVVEKKLHHNGEGRPTGYGVKTLP